MNPQQRLASIIREYAEPNAELGWPGHSRLKADALEVAAYLLDHGVVMMETPAPGEYSLRPRTEGMEYFAITFGRTGLRDGYVVVEAYTEDIARAWAHKEYGSLWSGIYPLTDFLDDVQKTGYRAVQLGRVETLGYEDASHV